jgi:general secretion pathway protein N
MMTRPRLFALFAVSLCAALIALMPMRVAVGMIDPARFGLSARAVTGTIWRGQLRGVVIGEVPLGDFAARLSPLALLRGRAAFALVGITEPSARATLIATPGTIGVEGATFKLAGGAAFAPFPVDTIDLTEANVRLDDGRCLSASGQVRVNITGDFGGIRLGQGLVGMLRCDGDAVSTNLVSQSAMERVKLSLSPGKGYNATIIISGNTPERIQKLATIGFRETAQGLVMHVSGKF